MRQLVYDDCLDSRLYGHIDLFDSVDLDLVDDTLEGVDQASHDA